MALGLIGALAGAGGSIIGALLGADAQDSAMAWNYYINQQNLRAQKQQQQRAFDYADKIRAEQHLGATDAHGNRTRFIEGQGWVTELSDEQQQLYDYFFKQELPERRAQFQRQVESSKEHDNVASALLNEFKRVERGTPMEAAAKLYLASTRGAGDANRELTETAMRQAARTGNSNIASIMGELGRASMDSRANARLNAEIQAEDYINQKFMSERGGLADLYSMFRGLANNPLMPSYDPTGITQSANSLMNVFSNQAQQGNSMGFNSRMQPAPQQDYIQPNNAWANAASSIGGALAGLGQRVSGMQQQNQMNDLLQQYITAGGQFDMSRGGIYEPNAARLRSSVGLY